MRRGRAAGLVATALFCAPLVARAQGAPPAPAPSDMDEARRHYQRGVQLYEQRADAAALAELERAYQLAPSWKLLYDIALVELAMRDMAGALRDFGRYLDGGKDEVSPARRAEVDRRIADLRDQVATLDVAVVAGAEVTLDDVAVGAAPLAQPLVVNPGRHKVSASMAGRVAEGRVVSVAGGDRARVELVLAEPAPPPAPIVIAGPAPPPVVVVREAPPRPASYLWVGWVATGTLAAAAIVTGVEALGANADLSRAKSDHPTSFAELDALSSRAHHWALASDLLALGALGAAGTTLYFTLRSEGAPPPVAVGVSPGGLALHGTF